MDSAKMGVFHTQLFRFWYCMGFLPYLGLDDDGIVAASLVRLLRAIEKQQPVSGKSSTEDSASGGASDTAIDIASAEWCIKNNMLDCVDKAESMLSLSRPSSTSLDGRLVQISIALTRLLDKAIVAQTDVSTGVEKHTDRREQMESLLSRQPPHAAGSVYNVSYAMVPPPTASYPPPLPPPGFSRSFNRGLPPGFGICSPSPPIWTRPEYNSDHASSGSIYKNTPSNIHTSNYTYLYYNGLINGPSPSPLLPLPHSRPAPQPVPPNVPHSAPNSSSGTPAHPGPRRKLASLQTMRDEYFCAAYDTASVHQDDLFGKIRLIVPGDTFTYACSFHPSSLKAVVCCVSGWGLGNSAYYVPHGRLQSLDYSQLVSMIMLSGNILHYTSSPIYRSARDPQPPQTPQALEPGKTSIFASIVTPGSTQGPAKPPLFKSALDALFLAPPSSLPSSGPPPFPMPGLLPPLRYPVRPGLSSGYEPPVRPLFMNPAFRKPGPTGSVGRPALYHPSQPYSLPPGSRYGPMPVPYGVPPWRGGPVPNRKELLGRRGKKHSNGAHRRILDNDDGSDGDAGKRNKRGTDSQESSEANSSSDKSDGSGSGSRSDSDSDSDSKSARRERRLLRRLSYSSLYTDSVLSDDGNKGGNEDGNKDDNDMDNEFRDDGEACACLYGKGRRSKKCNSPRCIYEDMASDELEKNQKYALKIKTTRQRNKAAVAARAAKKEKKKAEKEQAEHEQREKKEKQEKEKRDKKDRKSSLDKEDWEALSAGLSADTGSVVSLSESGSESSSESASGSESESESRKAPNTGASKVDIFAWMKEGKPIRELEKNEKKKKIENKDKAKRRGSFVVV